MTQSLSEDPSQSGPNPQIWRAELLGFVRRMGAVADAEDTVQEVYLRWLEAPQATKKRAWLYRVALNVLHDAPAYDGLRPPSAIYLEGPLDCFWLNR